MGGGCTKTRVVHFTREQYTGSSFCFSFPKKIDRSSCFCLTIRKEQRQRLAEKCALSSVSHPRKERYQHSNGHPRGWPSSRPALRMEAARVCAYTTWRSLEATVAPPNDMASIVGGALVRIFQLLRDQINHHPPPCTAIVWDEERSPNSKKEKTRTKRCQALRWCLRPGRPIAPSNILTRARGSIHLEICGAF